jgi:hypothetical protein
MSTAIEPQHFKNVLLAFLDETFDVCHGNFLDPNNGLLYTLGTITAEEASIPVGGKCASLAAQVAHTTFYIESFERHAIYNDNSRVDWGAIWRTVEKVTPEEWETLKEQLKQAYLRMDKLFCTNDDWDEDRMAGALSVVVHSVYHLGEIRQAMCTIGK